MSEVRVHVGGQYRAVSMESSGHAQRRPPQRCRRVAVLRAFLSGRVAAVRVFWSGRVAAVRAFWSGRVDLTRKRWEGPLACLVFLVLGAWGVGCQSGDDDSTESGAADGDMAVADGDRVVIGRADWSTGYFQAQVYKQLLEELDYKVSEPADMELSPSVAYLAMAGGEMDFWVNSWYPGHLTWLKAEMPDQSKVRDHVTVVGNEMLTGGVQGIVVTKSFADEYGITHIDQINDNPDILAAFDAEDANPNNGKADILGCPESWTCEVILNSQIAFSGWDNIAQVSPDDEDAEALFADYDDMFAEAVSKVEAGKPTAVYMWTPTAYILDLMPGQDVVWLAVEDVVDDSNPLGVEGGEAHDQRPGTANLGVEVCPAVAEEGVCKLGFTASDIQVTANTEWLDDNPKAAALFCVVSLSVVEVALAALEQTGAGGDAEEAIAEVASNWISENRERVDGWLEKARNAPAQRSCPETRSPNTQRG